MELIDGFPIISGVTKIGKEITTESSLFAGLTHTRKKALINHVPYTGKVKTGVGVVTSHTSSIAFSKSFSRFLINSFLVFCNFN